MADPVTTSATAGATTGTGAGPSAQTTTTTTGHPRDDEEDDQEEEQEFGDGGGIMRPSPAFDENDSMSISDIEKLFAHAGKLKTADEWPMWKFRVRNGMNVILSHYQLDSGSDVPADITHATFNSIIGHIDDTVLAHYLNESKPDALMAKLQERFDPQTTVTDSNDLYKLFHLRRPIYELDKLLDKAHDLYGRIVTKGLDILQYIYYSAINGIISPAYHHVRATYKSTIRQRTMEGVLPVFDPNVLMVELHCKFANYRATHAPGFKKSGQ